MNETWRYSWSYHPVGSRVVSDDLPCLTLVLLAVSVAGTCSPTTGTAVDSGRQLVAAREMAIWIPRVVSETGTGS